MFDLIDNWHASHDDFAQSKFLAKIVCEVEQAQ